MNNVQNMSDILSFWLEIMENHAEFILAGLSSKEKDIIENAKFFKESFLRLMKNAENLNEQNYGSIFNEAMELMKKFINFKRLIMKKLLECNIELSLPPTFINHMINEAMEFLRDSQIALANEKIDPVLANIELHKIWLPDASGHAANIIATLDPTENELIKKAEEFVKNFDGLFIKAVELGQMLKRTNAQKSTLRYLNEQVEEKISEFIRYLSNIKELREKCKVLGAGTLMPIVPDHMIREEKYYISRIKSLGIN